MYYNRPYVNVQMINSSVARGIDLPNYSNALKEQSAMYLPNEIHTEFIFYVYAYLRIDGTPYYIGKVKRNRAYEKHRSNLLPIDKSRIVFLETSSPEVGSLAIERRIIKWYGRKDLGRGILRNLTDGGEGSIGRRFAPTEIHKQHISSALTGKKHSVLHRANNSGAQTGKIQSTYTIEKRRKSLIGKVRTQSHKDAMSSLMSNRPKNGTIRYLSHC